MVVAINNLRDEVAAANKAANGAKLQTLKLRDELGIALRCIEELINQKRTIKIPLTLSVGKSK